MTRPQQREALRDAGTLDMVVDALSIDRRPADRARDLEELTDFVDAAEQVLRAANEALHFARRGDDSFTVLSLQLLTPSLEKLARGHSRLIRAFERARGDQRSG